MSDLFDQLKSAGPVKKKQDSPWKPSSLAKKHQEASLKSSSPVKKQQETPLKTSSPVKKQQEAPLKTSSPVKKKQEIPLKTSSQPSKNHDTNVEKFNSTNKSKSSSSSSGARRESMPTSTTGSVGKKGKTHKARSLSPPKFGAETAIKSLKVKLERKKLEKFLTRPLDEHANNIRVKHDKLKDDKQPKKPTPKDDKQPKKMIPIADKQQNKFIPLDEKQSKKIPFDDKQQKKITLIDDKQPKKITPKDEKQPKKMTPTKAQQKLFEPPMGVKKTKAQLLREFNVKPCKVRIHRDNLQQILREFKNEKKSKTSGNKRPATSFSGSPPSKKGKFSSTSTSKPKSNFFIKLNTSPPSKLEKKLKILARSSSAMAHHNKIKNSKTSITTPTKFSRSQLIRSFGQRFFNVHVKIERCTHPLMLTFVSNNRARRLQSKRNKSKNLSVSFREQVEVFGSSSDSDDSYDDFCAVPNRNARKNNSHNSKGAPATPVVMPARLKKVENGKVVDDIELDPSLFVDPNSLIASTPFSPGRKKRDHKSYSPLKDEGTPSPRKEQLKLANEKIPPSGLRRLNIDDDDDEDDDCEYIVPIEMPQHRISRTSSNATLDGATNASMPLGKSTAMFTDEIEDLTEEPTNNIADDINLTADTNNIVNNIMGIQGEKSNEPRHNANNQLEIISDDSFQSGNDVTEQNKAKSFASDKLPAITNLQNTPTLELNDALDMAEEEEANNQMESIHSPQKNGDFDDDDTNDNVDFNTSRKPMNTMDDLSMNLFMEDSQSNENDNHSKSFVDSLINETIDKLTKDIDEGPTDEQFTT